ncbi:MAG: Mur ligase family protein, partial [Bacteroidota bacterium]
MTLETALAKLFSLHQFGIKLGLDSTHKLLKHLGDPQNKLNAFHIAGSNGKGSTASFMASILTESSYKVGLYTSPHLVKFNERIRINGATIPDCYILTFMEELDEYININEPTFFELTTAMAFKYFAESNLDYAVIETGLGGRLDSTNVFNAIASIITTISDEHSNILGDTLTKIAIEKAGIIKNNSFVFCGMLNDEALNVIETVASQRKSDLTKLVDRVNSSGNSLLLKGTNKDYHLYSLPLRGRHQLNNAALAILAINKMMPNISSANIFNGLNNVLVNSGLQGRYEVY